MLVSQRGRVLAIPVDAFRRLMSTKPNLADTIFSAFVARREVLRTGEGARSVQIIGSRYSREAMALRAFAARSQDSEAVTEPRLREAGEEIRKYSQYEYLLVNRPMFHLMQIVTM